jgi:hypothetical protein
VTTTKPTEAHDATPATEPLALKLTEGLGPLPERTAFEAWFLERYSYSRAVLTNPIWASEVKDAAEAFAAGQAAERERCAKLCEAKYVQHAANGFPREASTARALTALIRA